MTCPGNTPHEGSVRVDGPFRHFWGLTTPNNYYILTIVTTNYNCVVSMSLKHVLLALLAEEPNHGYELKKRYDETLGALWPVQQAQIYNNLRLLEKAGQIELETRVEQENLPDQKLYRVTATGATELAEWLNSPVPSSRQLKDDLYLKVSTLASLPRHTTQLADLLWRQREIYLQHLRELEQALAEAELRADEVTASLLDGAILHAEADLTWLDRIEARLQPTEQRP